MPLELDSLRNSIRTLTDLLAVSENDARMGQFTDVERNGLRSGVIQNFEVAYELSWKLMARWLNTYVGPWGCRWRYQASAVSPCRREQPRPRRGPVDGAPRSKERYHPHL